MPVGAYGASVVFPDTGDSPEDAPTVPTDELDAVAGPTGEGP